MLRPRFLPLIFLALVAVATAAPIVAAGPPGVCYNPYANKPDPWAVAYSKHLIASPTAGLDHWANPPERYPDAQGAFIPGDPDVNAAYLARYGKRPIDWPPCGAELSLIMWPRVLESMFAFQWYSTCSENGQPTLREITDASFACPWDLYCKVRDYGKQPGYSEQLPTVASTPDMPSGLVHLPLPRTHPLWKSSELWNFKRCGWWYDNRYQAPAPVDPPPTPTPTPDPTPTPTPSPPVTCPACPPPVTPTCRIVPGLTARDLQTLRVAGSWTLVAQRKEWLRQLAEHVAAQHCEVVDP